MLAAIFSDLHVHDYKQFNKDGERLGLCLKVLDDIVAFCNQNEIKVILFPGDLFNTHQTMLTEVVDAVLPKFKEIFAENPDIVVYATSGNHDQSRKNLIHAPAVSGLRALSRLFPDNFILLDDDIATIADNVHVCGIPYYEYAEHFHIKLQEMHDRAVQLSGDVYLMIHQTPKGLGNEMIPYDTNPNDPLYEAFTHVYCGHIHAKQDLTERFSLVGSPIHRDAADVGQKKGFYVCNLLKPEKGKKFVYLKGYPEFLVKTEGEDLGEAENGNYVIVEPDYQIIAGASDAKVEEFNTSLDNKVLLENYWKEVDGENTELLTVGLEFV